MSGPAMTSFFSCAGVALALVVATAVQAQTTQKLGVQKTAWKVPRTEFGQPDLQGNWNNATLTQMERAQPFGTRNVMTAEEAAQIEGTAAKHVEENAKPTDPKLGIQDLPKDCGITSNRRPAILLVYVRVCTQIS